jgi:hypothetical protein
MRLRLKNIERETIFKKMFFRLGKGLVKLVAAAAAALSLFASSVSACACSHHISETKLEAQSCHSHSHQTALAENSSPHSFEGVCECLTAKPVPAIVAKSEKHKPDSGESCILANDPAIVKDLGPVKSTAVAMVAGSHFHFSSTTARSSPPRAPPRL